MVNEATTDQVEVTVEGVPATPPPEPGWIVDEERGPDEPEPEEPEPERDN